MKIIIDYESSWRNSFLDDEINGNSNLKRKYIASSKKLKDNDDNYKIRDVGLNTVLGILSRLIGDQRKLYQSKNELFDKYFFKDIENKISFKDEFYSWSELVYLRNMNNSDDPASYTGLLNENHPLLSSDYSSELWGVLFLDFKSLINFILNEKYDKAKFVSSVTSALIIERVSEFKDIKLDKVEGNLFVSEEKIKEVSDFFKNNIKLNDELRQVFPKLQKAFLDIDYIKNEKAVVRAIFCSALYYQALRLSNKYEMKGVVLKGFSVNGFTPKDFIGIFTGGKKKVYGNPYVRSSRFNGDEPLMLKKARGQLEININVDKEKGREIEDMIENAGVSSFYLGKKGLAFVSSIRV
jgi:hypothetical protein